MKKNAMYLFLGFILVLAGCAVAGTGTKTDTYFDESDNVSITEGDSRLITSMNVVVYLDGEAPPSSARAVLAAPESSFPYTITQIGRIAPTTVNGHTVQANDILISGNKAYVAYNTAGPVFDGAIQILGINGNNVSLEREIQFAGMDIISLSLNGSILSFGGMADPDIFDGHRSFVGTVDVNGPRALDIVDSFVFLNSYAATGVTVHNNQYYVSVGAADGGLEILDADRNPLSPSPVIDIDDIRDIESYSGGIIVLAGTTDSDATDGRILIVKNDVVTREILLPDFNSPEAKATIEVNGNYAYLGLSALGFQIVNLQTEEIIAASANPDSDAAHVTNSISYEGNLIFSANGEYGFQVFDYIPSDTTVELAGSYSFSGKTSGGQNFSANQIVYRNQYLFVAAGVGGILMYSLDEK